MSANPFKPNSLWLLLTMLAFASLGCLALGISAVSPASAMRALSNDISTTVAPRVPCDPVSFATPVRYTIGTRPRSAAMGDFNRDGHLDIVVTDYSGNSVSVLLGNADGTFQQSVNYGVGVHPVTPALGDFNEDGIPDLVVANYDSANVSILIGNGDGTFHTAINFSSGIGAYGATVGDFNEDGYLDVAVSNVNFAVVTVMMGNGNGTLQNPVQYAANPRPQVIATADFNGDGHLDLITPNYSTTTISLLLGNGNGTFQPAVTFPVGAGPDFLTVADLNGDSHPDLIIPHYSTNNVSIMLGNGNGTFQPEVLYPSAGANPLFASVADFNGDSAPDLVVANYGSDTVAILPGNGDGAFRPAITFPVGAGTSPVAVGAGDFNGDGLLDMFAANENIFTVSVFINTCSLSPTATPTSTSTPPAPSPTPCDISFSDVQPGDYFYEAVRYLYCMGAVSGYGDGTFRPYNVTTRAQLTKIIVLAEGWPIDTKGGPHFTDVPSSNPFYDYIETAYNHAIITGYQDGTFRPDNSVTRAQLSKIIVNAQGWPIDATGGPHFTDVPSSNPFYGFIETAYNHAIITGYQDGTFRPDNSATRGQISKIVYQAITQP